MPFELIMLLGFFGTVLASLLPAAPARTAGESFRGGRRQRRCDGEWRRTVRCGRVTARQETAWRRSAGHGVA